MADDLPYTVKLSGGHEKCSRCNNIVKAQELQLGLLIQSTTEDAKIPKWYHIDCFFKDVRPKSEILFDNFTKLSNKDQKAIRKRIANVSGNTNGKKGLKRTASDAQLSVTPPSIDNFAVQPAQSSQNLCVCCFKWIDKGKIEIKKMIPEVDTAVWYHLNCFAKNSHTLGWYNQPDDMPGFKTLKANERDLLKKKMNKSNDGNNNEPAVKKLKTGTLDDVNEIIERKITRQNKDLHDWKEKLRSSLTSVDLTAILNANEQFVPEDYDDILMHTADVICFGALKKCENCKEGKFIFGNSAYKCTGNLSHFAKCNNVVKEPTRSPVKIPQHIQDAHFFLKVTLEMNIRATKIIPSNFLVNASKPLFDMEFAIVGSLQKSYNDIKNEIEKLGGKVTSFFMTNKTAAVISKVEEVRKDEKYMKPIMKQAKQIGLQVVNEDFLTKVKAADPFSLIKDMNISPWNCIDPCKRIQRNGAIVSKSDSFYDDKSANVQKWKNGFAVEAECNLKDVHVLGHFIASMTLVDIVKNKNSYCRMQLLESDDGKGYWVFEKQGRISTKIGTSTLKDYKTRSDAISAFKARFEELTGNTFGTNFVKKPDKFQLMDIVVDKQTQVLNHLIESQLEPSVYDVMKLICDQKAMKETMLSFNLDTDQMPLGKISKTQIKDAQNVLKELSKLVRKKGSESQFIEASNRFYTMIPHKFIQERPTVINTVQMIQQKIEMLERLREIEFTYSLLDETDGMKNPLDSLYHKLNTDISPLDRKSTEYGQITTYVQQTHYHSYHVDSIEVQDIFEVVRREEETRFEKFKTLHNRKLLWHGSSLTNFVGILSGGLQLAPTDVEINGKAFGNGIYFADAIAKSAQYCNTTKEGDALLLLCEVALGDSHETQKTDSSLIIPPNGKHSVKAVGNRYSRSQIVRADGVIIPHGFALLDRDSKSEIEFNEYIVYNEAQVKIRYLVKAKFKPHYDDDFDEDDDDHHSECSCGCCATTDDNMTDSDDDDCVIVEDN